MSKAPGGQSYAHLRQRAAKELETARAEVQRLEGFLTTLDQLAGVRIRQHAVAVMDHVAGLAARNGAAAPVAVPPSLTLKAFIAQHADWEAPATAEIDRLLAAWQAAGRTATRASVAAARGQIRRARARGIRPPGRHAPRARGMGTALGPYAAAIIEALKAQPKVAIATLTDQFRERGWVAPGVALMHMAKRKAVVWKRGQATVTRGPAFDSYVKRL